MLTFRHYVAPSAIEGLGLFTDEDLARDAVLWAFVPGFDLAFSPAQYASLPPQARAYIDRYGWHDDDDGLLHISVDGDKYTNHSDAPNTYKDDRGQIRARVDVPRGTEITSDYGVFDRSLGEKLKGA